MRHVPSLSRVSRGTPTDWPEFSATNVRPGWVSRPAVGLGDRPIPSWASMESHQERGPGPAEIGDVEARACKCIEG